MKDMFARVNKTVTNMMVGFRLESTNNWVTKSRHSITDTLPTFIMFVTVASKAVGTLVVPRMSTYSKTPTACAALARA